MIDIGIAATGGMAVACFRWGRGKWMRHALLASWCITALERYAGATKSVTVLTLALLDLAIAGVALARYTNDPTRQDARTVGALSMAIMPAHFVMSATAGHVDWLLYASSCNAIFILQCLIAGGWLDGVGRFLVRIVNRFGAVHHIRNRP